MITGIYCISHAEKIGGAGKVVDEVKFKRRKYNRQWYIDGQWIFAGIERNQKTFYGSRQRQDTGHPYLCHYGVDFARNYYNF